MMLESFQITYPHIYQSAMADRNGSIGHYWTKKAQVKVNPLGSNHKNLWEEVTATENYIRNWIDSDVFQRDGVTHIEELTGIKPDIFHLRKFGCTAFSNIPSQFREGKFG